MCRMRYVVTGGTGFIGKRLVDRILALPDTAAVHVLVRRESLGRFERLALSWDDRVQPLVGDLTALPLEGISRESVERALLDLFPGVEKVRTLTAWMTKGSRAFTPSSSLPATSSWGSTEA